MEQIPQKSQKVYRSEDGKLYGVPSWFSDDGFGTCGDGIAVRNDIYKGNGSPKFSTLDDYYSYMETIKNANLNTNGVQVWPMAFYMLNTNLSIVGEVANLYGSNIMGYKCYNTANKRVELSLRSPEIDKALTFLNKCYNSGMIDPECFTFDRTKFDEAFCTGKYATVMGNYWALWNADAALSAADPNMYYTVIDAPQGASGVKQYYGFYDTAGNMSFEVTKNCKEQEAVARFIDYFLSDEGNILDFYGVEGQTMEFKDGKPYLMDGVYEAKLADFDGYGKKTGVRVFDVMMDATWNWERNVESEIRSANRSMVMKYAFDGTYLKALSVDSSTDAGILNAEISANLVAEFTKIIIAKDNSQIEAMVQALLKNYEGKGLSKLEDEWSAQYAKMIN
jgi:putative aldouronate transport system substrate-binding protein